ncbi:LOW QUALITY PROTEIN: hypothetical protein M8C21_032518 [Ambrosia artemisiifolia]|uniref:Uncharacterized protein n=1 Tax=Ambrosia artemisiifolia TaxID=4212 RepID=A0AAD5CK61_AMBAR|nr:LOW QUALITY PROTEIN: hypothetical protein M8C21_032518 [Ambrosia artemisiifolia]
MFRRWSYCQWSSVDSPEICNESSMSVMIHFKKEDIIIKSKQASTFTSKLSSSRRILNRLYQHLMMHVTRRKKGQGGRARDN